jgi:hypothetical protein
VFLLYFTHRKGITHMNIIDFLKNKLVVQPDTVSQDQLIAATSSDENMELMKKFGIVTTDIRAAIQDQSLILYERSQLYQTVDRSLTHPLMSAAVGMFADVATNRSQIQNATVWVTSKNKEYQYQIEKMLDVINMEEVIYDWAWTIASFGDLFVQVFGQPGVGIVSVNDDQHPVNVSRVDFNGRLVGFFETPMGYAIADERKLLAPWEYTHLRLLGAKKRRPIYSDPQYSEFRTVSIMTPDIRRLTSKYGTSVLADALPIWKRLRMTEDSILMARINKTPTRYVYKITIPEGNANAESVATLIDQYVSELKRARAINTDPDAGGYTDRFQGMGALEDLIVPVWGNSDNFNIEKIGGEVDIRWIKDVEELRNQLATALKVPLGLLSGYSKEGNPGGLGQGSIERMDIRFARQARRVQRSLINGLTRLAQIHLAYQGINPDLNLFEIHMAETSTAEEEEMKDALDKGVDIADRMYEFYAKALGPDFNGEACAEYINQKFLKLNDADLEKWKLKGNETAFDSREEEPVPGVEGPGGSSFGPGLDSLPDDMEEEGPTPEGTAGPNPFKESVSDLKSALPIHSKKLLNEKKEEIGTAGCNESWEKEWGSKMVKIVPKEQKAE